MRIGAGHLGIGQTVPAIATPDYNPPAPPTITPAYPLSPSLPNNYSNTTEAGVIPGNDIGQTISTLASNAPDLCAQEGGIWNATTQACNMCPQNSLAAFFLPQTWNADTGQCATSYTPLLIAGGGLAVTILLIAMMSRK